jgi:uncharacterized membrane protein
VSSIQRIDIGRSTRPSWLLPVHAWQRFSRVWSGLYARPALVFIILSVAFGTAISIAVPPLRGPDEIAHFLRIHSYARGELLPPTEVDGRKGILINSDLYAQLAFFKNAGERFARNKDKGLRYGEIMQDHPPAGGLVDETEEPTRFMPFAGTEGYSPVAYAPHILAAALGTLLQLDFPSTLFLMRVLGLIAFTMVAAYAVALTPALKWAFVLIAMLPVSLYNRSVLSADGAALSSALVVTALCFSAIRRYRGTWERSLWMTVCALTKQPQIVFIVLELMARRVVGLRRRWSNLALVVMPSLILSPLWVMAVSADVGAWRLLEQESHPREHFDPLWKLAYMWEHPLHFPLAMWTAMTVWGDRLWQELIGILGWQDVVLPVWTYVAQTVLLVLLSLQTLDVGGALRARVAIVTAIGLVGYVITVYLIFFLTYTPLDVDHVRGVQGRYFVIALPMAAIFIAATINVALPRGLIATMALTGSLISGIASFQALLEAHWSVPQ